VHAPLLQLFWQYLLRPAGLAFEARFAVIVLVGMPAIVGAAYLFHRAFEKPFMSAPAKAPAELKAGLAASPSP